VRSLVLGILLLSAGPVQAADLVRTLERGVRLAGATPTRRELILRTRSGELRLDPDRNDGHGIIGLETWFRRSGFFLDEQGKLPAAQRAALLQSLGTGVTRKQIVRSLRSALRKRRAERARLAAGDPQVDALLEKARAVTGDEEIPLYEQGNASISIRRAGGRPLLVVYDGSTESGVRLDGNETRGFSVGIADRERLAEILLRR
jgi:hypothetical protein